MKKILIILLMVVVIVPVILIGLFVLSFNGGWQGIKNSITPAPDPHSSKLVDKRKESEKFINTTFHELEEVLGITDIATGTHDVCYEGEANWKRVESFSNRCSQKFTRFYGFDGSVVEAVKSIDKFLGKTDWRNPSYDPAEVWLSSRIGMPDLHYYRSEESTLLIDFEAREQGVIRGFASQQAAGFSLEYNVKNFQDDKKVFAEIASKYPYAVVISVEDIYFQN